MKILIKGGKVLDPATRTEKVSDVLVEDGIITKIDKKIQDASAEVMDASGCYVMPGFIDLHVHLRDPGLEHKETVETGAMAAARGGYTTILAMPNTKPVVDNADVVNYVHNKAMNLAPVHVLQIGAITKGQNGKELADIKGMAEVGIPALSEDGKSVMDSSTYMDAMLIAKELNLPIFAHCEDVALVRGGVMNEGAKAKELGLPGILNQVEDIIVARDIMLEKAVGGQLHLCHCSTTNSVKLIEIAKNSGIRVTGEACPHHFVLCDEDIPSDDPNYKMNPPLRSRKDMEAIREALKNDILDVIATDHAPHTALEKGVSMKNAPFGIVGLETAASLTYTYLVDKDILTPMQMAEKMSYNPAKIIGLDKGSVAEGKVADLVVFDPTQEYTICAADFASKGRNTPFDGWQVKGAVKATIVDGVVVYENKA